MFRFIHRGTPRISLYYPLSKKIDGILSKNITRYGPRVVTSLGGREETYERAYPPRVDTSAKAKIRK